MPNVRERDGGSFEIVFSSDRPTWGNGQPAKGKQDACTSHTPGGPRESGRRRAIWTMQSTPLGWNSALHCPRMGSACTSGVTAIST